MRKLFLILLFILLNAGRALCINIPKYGGDIWPITSDYGPRMLGSGWDLHRGIDYGGGYGEDVVTVSSGNIRTIAFDSYSGWYIKIEDTSEPNYWRYCHLFSGTAGTPAPPPSGNWELLVSTKVIDRTYFQEWDILVLVKKEDGDIVKAFTTSSNLGFKLKSSGIIIHESVDIESIGPVGNSGPAGTPVHLHIGVGPVSDEAVRDNPLYYLEHSTAPLSLEMSSPTLNHIFTNTELSGEYSFQAVINSVGGYDLDKADFWIHQNDGTEYQLGNIYNPYGIAFIYGGMPDEGKTDEVQATTTSWRMACVEPMQINGANLPGRDKFVLFGENPVRYQEGTHQFVVKAYDINYNTYTFITDFIIDRTKPAFRIRDDIGRELVSGDSSFTRYIYIEAEDDNMLESVQVLNGGVEIYLSSGIAAKTFTTPDFFSAGVIEVRVKDKAEQIKLC